MNILVTGGAGFIGSHLVEWLVHQGHHVRVFDNFSSGSRKRFILNSEHVTIIEGDIRNFGELQQATNGVEYVFHLAAMVSVLQSVEQPIEAEQINSLGSLHVLEAARQAKAKRVVMASSCAIYGNTTQVPTNETVEPDPLSPYATSKLAAENLGRLYTRLYEAEAVSLRFFNVYGPRQDPNSPYAAVIPRFAQMLLHGQQPTIYGDGEQSRDFVFVGDIVGALWAAATTPQAAGQSLNVGTGVAVSIRELTTLIGEVLGIPVNPIYAPARSGEVRHSCADPSLLEQLTGFRPAMPLREGIAATIDALR
ncbi:MAG: SDR family oxidoreductase [Roseiflexaceae bacterium]